MRSTPTCLESKYLESLEGQNRVLAKCVPFSSRSLIYQSEELDFRVGGLDYMSGFLENARSP